MDALHFCPQHPVPPRPGRAQSGIDAPRDTSVIGGRGNRQNPADRLDPAGTPMIVDERDHGFDRRSSFARAKYADALRRISLAWRSSLFSRSSALMRPRSSLVGPTRLPRSRSTCRTSAAASQLCSRSWPRSSRSPPTVSRTPRRHPAPLAPLAPEHKASSPPLSSSPSSLHPLNGWSLRQTRCGSLLRSGPIVIPWRQEMLPWLICSS